MTEEKQVPTHIITTPKEWNEAWDKAANIMGCTPAAFSALQRVIAGCMKEATINLSGGAGAASNDKGEPQG